MLFMFLAKCVTFCEKKLDKLFIFKGVSQFFNTSQILNIGIFILKDLLPLFGAQHDAAAPDPQRSAGSCLTAFSYLCGFMKVF